MKKHLVNVLYLSSENLIYVGLQPLTQQLLVVSPPDVNPNKTAAPPLVRRYQGLGRSAQRGVQSEMMPN